jgi:hypothetical protein
MHGQCVFRSTWARFVHATWPGCTLHVCCMWRVRHVPHSTPCQLCCVVHGGTHQHVFSRDTARCCCCRRCCWWHLVVCCQHMHVAVAQVAGDARHALCRADAPMSHLGGRVAAGCAGVRAEDRPPRIKGKEAGAHREARTSYLTATLCCGALALCDLTQQSQ